MPLEGTRKHGRILDYAPLVVGKLRLKRFAEGHRFRGDDMHQRSALDSWEDGAVQRVLLCYRRAGKHEPSTWSAQRLVGGRGGKVGERY